MSIIDIHSHVVLPETMNQAGKYGPSVGIEDGHIVLAVGSSVSRMKLDPAEVEHLAANPEAALDRAFHSANVERRIQEMDEIGLSKIGVTISPLFYLYWAEPEIGVPFATLQNDALANYCSAYPDRLFFMATLPLQDMDASLAELQRAVGEKGAKAINLGGGAIAGHELDDEYFWPLYAKAVELDVPLFVHPYPEPAAQEGASDDYNMSWVLGYLQQESTAFVRLVYGGVLDEFPDLKVCITHGGGVIPFQLGRVDAFSRYMPGVKAKRPIPEYVKNFYFDILIHDPRARRFMVDVIGADNLVYGSNYGSPQDKAGVEFLDMGLPAEDREKIASGNAIRIFNLG